MENKLTIKNQSLAIQQENELLIVARNSIKHKPKLAVIVESKKIRDYSLEEQKKGNTIIRKGKCHKLKARKIWQKEKMILFQ